MGFSCFLFLWFLLFLIFSGLFLLGGWRGGVWPAPSVLICRLTFMIGTVGKSAFCSPNGTTDATYLQCHHNETPTGVYFFIFVLSQLVAGAGACPLFTLGPAFLDENVRPKFVPIYLGFFYSCILLGPGIGATLAGKFLSVYVDLKQVSLIHNSNNNNM